MKRGDIGPISDDIPSIFPIVFGVLLFMGTALFTAQRIDERNQYLELRKAAVGLSYVVLNQGYVSDEEFDKACAEQYKDYADRRRISFIVSLKKFCRYVSLDQRVADIFSTQTAYPGPPCNLNDPLCIDSTLSRTGKLCPNPAPRIKNSRTGVMQPVSSSNQPPNFQTLNFPVAVQCNQDGTVRGPGLVNVIVWR